MAPLLFMAPLPFPHEKILFSMPELHSIWLLCIDDRVALFTTCIQRKEIPRKRKYSNNRTWHDIYVAVWERHHMPQVSVVPRNVSAFIYIMWVNTSGSYTKKPISSASPAPRPPSPILYSCLDILCRLEIVLCGLTRSLLLNYSQNAQKSCPLRQTI